MYLMIINYLKCEAGHQFINIRFDEYNWCGETRINRKFVALLADQLLSLVLNFVVHPNLFVATSLKCKLIAV